MQKIILQIPMDIKLKKSAEKVATAQGFSSLQEIVRVFLSQLATNKIDVTLQDSVQLSPENDKRYAKAMEDMKAGINVFEAENVDDFLKQLSK